VVWFFFVPAVAGEASGVLSRPFTVVLTQRAAKKYFGDADPIGKLLRYNGEYDLEVTGVMADPPSNSSMHYDFVASLSSIAGMKDLSWMTGAQQVGGGMVLTWLRLKAAGDSSAVAKTLGALSGGGDVYSLTALPDVYLTSHFGDLSNIRYLGVFPLVAGLILLLALVNYMSLATAKATTRAKEVGVRKVMGAGRRLIAGQFYTESAVYAILSFVVGMGLFLWVRSPFMALLQLKIDDGFLVQPVVLAFYGVLMLGIVFLAGSYPALVLSRFNPVAVLYGRMSRRRGGEWVRRFFSVFQFTISMVMIVSSIVIGKELYHLRHADTGVDRENVVMIPFGESLSHYPQFRREAGSVAGVRQVGTAEFALYDGYNEYVASVPGSDKSISMFAMGADRGFMEVTGLRWKQRPVSVADLTDGQHVLLNEAGAAGLGLPADARGRRVRMGSKIYTVSGVLKDFNYESMQQGIGPLCVFVSSDTVYEGKRGCLFARIGPHVNIPSVVDALRRAYLKYDRQTAFEYQFMDDAFDKMYRAEDRLSALFDVFTVITVVIACLGLFALSTFSAEQRLREIGIRKILGASAMGIGRLLSVDFLQPVLVAVLIASPLAWWLMHRWLDNFAYRTSLSWWIFPAAGGVLAIISFGTVLFQSVRAARVNPVENLRTD